MQYNYVSGNKHEFIWYLGLRSCLINKLLYLSHWYAHTVRVPQKSLLSLLCLSLLMFSFYIYAKSGGVCNGCVENLQKHILRMYNVYCIAGLCSLCKARAVEKEKKELQTPEYPESFNFNFICDLVYFLYVYIPFADFAQQFLSQRKDHVICSKYILMISTKYKI